MRRKCTGNCTLAPKKAIQYSKLAVSYYTVGKKERRRHPKLENKLRFELIQP